MPRRIIIEYSGDRFFVLMDPNWKLVSDLVKCVQEQVVIIKNIDFHLEKEDGVQLIERQSIAVVTDKLLR